MVEFLIYGILLWFIIQVLVAHIHFRKQETVREEIGELVTKAQEQLKKILVVRVEKMDDMFYLYNQTSGEFICQGKSLEEVRKAYLLRYPDKRALVDEGKDLLFKETSNA